jgi:hypothetical protein
VSVRCLQCARQIRNLDSAVFLYIDGRPGRARQDVYLCSRRACYDAYNDGQPRTAR